MARRQNGQLQHAVARLAEEVPARVLAGIEMKKTVYGQAPNLKKNNKNYKIELVGANCFTNQTDLRYKYK